jgi:hypothetical protein
VERAVVSKNLRPSQPSKPSNLSHKKLSGARKDRFESYHRSGGRSKRKNYPKKRMKRARPPPEIKGPHTDSVVPDPREERRLDGSRDYFVFRDHGQFGSHPSFDACDDESDP